MNRFVKRILFVFVALITLIGAAGVALRILFPPAALRKQLQDDIRNRFHRELQFDGMQVGFRGLTLEQVRLSEKPDFNRGLLLSADSLHVRWAWLPFLRYKLRLTSDWRITDLRLHNGTFHLANTSLAGGPATLTAIELHLSQWDPTSIAGSLTAGSLKCAYYKAQDIALDWNLKNPDPTWINTRGSAALRHGQGQFEKVSALLGPNRLPPGLPEIHRIPITALSAHFRFDQGIVAVDSLTVQGPLIHVSGTGLAELRSERLDGYATLQSPAGSSLGDMKARLHVAGTLTQPKVLVDSLRKKDFKATIQTRPTPVPKKKVPLKKPPRKKIH